MASDTNRFDLNKLLKFSRENALSFTVTFSQGDETMEIDVRSPDPAECLYMKRVPSVEYFIEHWQRKLGVQDGE